MGLRQLKVTLRDDVVSPRHVDAFDQARAREPVLAAHAGILSVLAVMADDTDSRYAERDALTRAFIREHQRADGSFWASVLILAYAPMLTRLRGRICGNAFGRHDLDQMVVAAFLEEVRRFPLEQRPNRLAMFLRQGTQRSVFRHVITEQFGQQCLANLTELQALDAEPLEVFAPCEGNDDLDEEERTELVQLLTAFGAGLVPPARLELVVATYVRGERLRDYVIRTNPGLDSPRLETVYQRVKRARLRTIRKLRPVIAAAASLQEEPDALGGVSAGFMPA